MARSSYSTPKHCWVRRISIEKGGVEIGYACEGTTLGAKPTDEHGREGPFTHRRGDGVSTGNYPTKFLRGVTSVSHRGVHITGVGTKLGFTMIPAAAKCRRDGSTLTCKMVGDLSSTSLAGRRRRR